MLNDGGGDASSPPRFPLRQAKSMISLLKKFMISVGTMALALLSDQFTMTRSKVTMARTSDSGNEWRSTVGAHVDGRGSTTAAHEDNGETLIVRSRMITIVGVVEKYRT
jgi:hypothetical protein